MKTRRDRHFPISARVIYYDIQVRTHLQMSVVKYRNNISGQIKRIGEWQQSDTKPVIKTPHGTVLSLWKES